MSEEKTVYQAARTRLSIPVVIALVAVAALVGAISAIAVRQVDAFTESSRPVAVTAADEATEPAEEPEGVTKEPQEQNWEAAPIEDPFELFRSGEWDPFQEMQAMHERMEKIFNDSWTRLHQSPLQSLSERSRPLTAAPSMDLTEQDTEYVVHVDMPGLEDGNADVTLEGNRLSISGSRVDVVSDSSGGQVIRQERRATHFARTMTLPSPVDADGMTTSYENGVLTIRIPKAGADSPSESNPM